MNISIISSSKIFHSFLFRILKFLHFLCTNCFHLINFHVVSLLSYDTNGIIYGAGKYFISLPYIFNSASRVTIYYVNNDYIDEHEYRNYLSIRTCVNIATILQVYWLAMYKRYFRFHRMTNRLTAAPPSSRCPTFWTLSPGVEWSGMA